MSDLELKEKIFTDNGDILKEICDYMEVSTQYFEEEFSDFLSCEGSWVTTDKNITYTDVMIQGFTIESDRKKFEVIPVSIIDEEFSKVLENKIIIVEI